jgi:hypothetical protein
MESFLVTVGSKGEAALLNEFREVFVGDAHLPRLGQQGVDAFGQNLDAFAPR